MNQTQISSTTVLHKLQITLSEDVNTLKSMLRKRDPKSKSYNLINSLLKIKEQLIRMLPFAKDRTAGSPTTAQKLKLVSYDHKLKDFKDEMFLSKTMQTIEQEQLEYLTYALRGNGLPDHQSKKIEKIIGIYHKIVHQLDRNNKTKAINPIVG